MFLLRIQYSRLRRHRQLARHHRSLIKPVLRHEPTQRRQHTPLICAAFRTGSLHQAQRHSTPTTISPTSRQSRLGKTRPISRMSLYTGKHQPPRRRLFGTTAIQLCPVRRTLQNPNRRGARTWRIILPCARALLAKVSESTQVAIISSYISIVQRLAFRTALSPAFSHSSVPSAKTLNSRPAPALSSPLDRQMACKRRKKKIQARGCTKTVWSTTLRRPSTRPLLLPHQAPQAITEAKGPAGERRPSVKSPQR